MKKILLTALVLLLVATTCFAQSRRTRLSQPSGSGGSVDLSSPGPIGNTTPDAINGTTGYFSGAVNIPATDPSTIANLESGISPYGVNGNTTLTANRVYTVRGLATAPIAKIDGTLTPGSKYFVIDHSRSGDPVQSSGATVWAKDKKILFGSGGTADSGETVFVLSGNTNVMLQFYAVDSSTLVMLPTDATIYHVD